MKRVAFIRNVVGCFGIAVLPKELIAENNFPDHPAQKTILTPKGNDFFDGDEFYDALVRYSKTDEVYDRIHSDIGSIQAMEDIVNESLLIVNKNRLPGDLQNDEVTKAFEEGIVNLDEAFDEKGYVAAQINRVAELSARIKRFVPVKDKDGEVFWEVVFKK